MCVYWRLLLPSGYAAWTPLTARMTSIDPAGNAQSVACARALRYSRSTDTEAPGNAAATASLIEARVASPSALSASWTMTTTEVSASWPDCALGPLCPFLDVSAVSGSIVGEAVAPGADWPNRCPGWTADRASTWRRASSRDRERARAHPGQKNGWLLHGLHSHTFDADTRRHRDVSLLPTYRSGRPKCGNRAGMRRARERSQ